MINGHGGNIFAIARRLGCAASEIVDMSSNVNPLGPPPGLTAYLKENLNVITALPEVDSNMLVHSFAARYGVNSDSVLAGNGSTQFIYAIPQALGSKRALILGPTYADYADACHMHNIDFKHFIAQESQEFKADIHLVIKQLPGNDTVFLCNPNNPTGTLYTAAELELLCRSHSNINFIIDESYLPFVNCGDRESMIGCGLHNVVVLNSMSKIFRISGLRIGFIIASENIIGRLTRYSLPWSVNALAQIAVRYLMEHEAEVNAFIGQTRKLIETERNRFAEKLKSVADIKLFPSTTSFILAKLLKRHTADTVCRHLSNEKILIRNCSNFKGLSNRFIRISLKKSAANQMLADKLLSLSLPQSRTKPISNGQLLNVPCSEQL